MTEPLPTRYYVARHPQLFRPGKVATIVEVRSINGRDCFHLRYPDGMEDDTPVENEDFTGKGGAGYFYDIWETRNASGESRDVI